MTARKVNASCSDGCQKCCHISVGTSRVSVLFVRLSIFVTLCECHGDTARLTHKWKIVQVFAASLMISQYRSSDSPPLQF